MSRIFLFKKDRKGRFSHSCRPTLLTNYLLFLRFHPVFVCCVSYPLLPPEIEEVRIAPEPLPFQTSSLQGIPRHCRATIFRPPLAPEARARGYFLFVLSPFSDKHSFRFIRVLGGFFGDNNVQPASAFRFPLTRARSVVVPVDSLSFSLVFPGLKRLPISGFPSLPEK